jgi:hypothetical protein
MNKVAKSPWWASIGFGRPQAEQDTDYADMGTAFGLDASLSPEVDYLPGRESGDVTDPVSDATSIRRL